MSNSKQRNGFRWRFKKKSNSDSANQPLSNSTNSDMNKISSNGKTNVIFNGHSDEIRDSDISKHDLSSHLHVHIRQRHLPGSVGTDGSSQDQSSSSKENSPKKEILDNIFCSTGMDWVPDNEKTKENQKKVKISVEENHQYLSSMDKFINRHKEDTKKNNKLKALTASALSRPFGRLVPVQNSDAWAVEVNHGVYDEEINMCKYNIIVKNRIFDGKSKRSKDSVTVSVHRTLKDFLWLEEALREEYYGSLFIPLLPLTIVDWTKLSADAPINEDWDPVRLSSTRIKNQILAKQPVDNLRLADWLRAVLNFVRGKGELILKQKHPVDITLSEAMETFLYKTSESLPDPSYKDWKRAHHGTNWLHASLSKIINVKQSENSNSLQTTLKNVVTSKVFCFQFDPPGKDARDYSWRESFLSEDLRVQRKYIFAQSQNLLKVFSSLHSLLEREIELGAAWKRFAISLSNLHSAQKQIQNCKVGEVVITKTKQDEKMEERLRILARQKMDRSGPSLKMMTDMIGAYYTDFASVDPNLQEYVDNADLVSNDLSNNNRSPMHFANPLQTILCGMSSENNSSIPHEIKDHNDVKECLEINEERIRSALLQYCLSMPIRLSRMSWKFLKMEFGQVNLLLAAAEKMQTSIQKMDSTNLNANNVDLADNDAELELVRGILDLGLKRKFKFNPSSKSTITSTSLSSSEGSTENQSSTTEGGNQSDEGPSNHGPVVNQVLSFTSQRHGRWNEELVQMILTASGIGNAQNLIESNSREYKIISKCTERLKKEVGRCRSALQYLQYSTHGLCHDGADLPPQAGISDLRESFLCDFTAVLAGSWGKEVISPIYDDVLASRGINSLDPAGWTVTISSSDDTTGKCGSKAFKYQQSRDRNSLAFFSQISDRLQDFDLLIESLESFLYMYRLGEHIESHYSRIRSRALVEWEKKTDLTTAVTLASRKKLPLLVKELEAKINAIPSSVSYSGVKAAKERHLGSKMIKKNLETLATRRLQRIKDSGCCLTLSIMKDWAIREDSCAKYELRHLVDVIQEIEAYVQNDERIIDADGGAHRNDE